MSKNVSQMGITKAKLETAKGMAKQIMVVRDDSFRIVVMDGVTAGGHPHALREELEAQKTALQQAISNAVSDVVRTSEQTLADEKKEQARNNLGLGTAAVKAEGDFVSTTELTTALSELITEFGGEVPSD